jgi:cysteine desulfurase
MKKRIYLDNSATTPVDPRVLDAMIPYFTTHFGNAASRNHPFGWEAEEGVDYAREQVAKLIGAEDKEIIFTSGATESINLALKGAFEMYAKKGNHITVKTEHKAVLDTCKHIEKMGGEVTYLDVKYDATVDLAELEAAIKPNTIMICIMWANNETGVIQDVEAIGKICAKHGVLFMSDITQAAGKVPIDVKKVGIHLAAFTAHKMYGPKGVGALFVNRIKPRVKVVAQMDGGGHERGMRSGTMNVPAIVGFGKAAEICLQEMEKDAARLSKLRDRLQTAFLGALEEVTINGNPNSRLPHVTNMSFKHVEGEGLMMTFNQEIGLSSGSACTSASLEPSYVLVAMGLGDDLAHSSLRFSLGRFTTDEDIDYTVQAIAQGVNHMRDLSPIWEMYKEGIDLSQVEWSEH